MSIRPLHTLALLCCAALAGCGDGSGLLGVAGSAGAATVRFVNASARPLDLAVNGTVPGANANIAPGASVGCFAVADPTVPGLTVRQAGTTTDLGGFTPQFSSGGRHTVIAYPGPSGLVQFAGILTTVIPITGRSALRVFNGSSGLGNVDVYVTAPGGTLGTPKATGLGFGSATGSFDVSAGTSHVRLTTNGTTTVVFDAGNQVLETGKSYTLIVSSATSAFLVVDC